MSEMKRFAEALANELDRLGKNEFLEGPWLAIDMVARSVREAARSASESGEKAEDRSAAALASTENAKQFATLREAASRFDDIAEIIEKGDTYRNSGFLRASADRIRDALSSLTVAPAPLTFATTENAEKLADEINAFIDDGKRVLVPEAQRFLASLTTSPSVSREKVKALIEAIDGGGYCPDWCPVCGGGCPDSDTEEFLHKPDCPLESVRAELDLEGGE